MSKEIPETSRPCPNCRNNVVARRTGNIKCKMCGMKLTVTPDGGILSNEYEPTIEDVMAHSYEIETDGSKWWSGHVNRIIGAQCESEAHFAFSIPLEHIPDNEHNKPDFFNSEHRIVVEVYAGVDIGRIDSNLTDIMGIPVRQVKKYELHHHLMEVLRHAKDKMNQDTLEYCLQKHGMEEGFTYLAMYVMEYSIYAFLTKEMMIDVYSECILEDYYVDGIVVYQHPAGFNNESFGGDVFVFYEDESRIDRKVFAKHAEFICLKDHRKGQVNCTDLDCRISNNSID